MQSHVHRPCREIEWLDLEIGESDHRHYDRTYIEDRLNYSKVPKEYWNNYWGIAIRILTPRFKLITHHKEIDFQTLVGYVGGYIGIVLGVALVQIPDAVLSAYLFVREQYRFKGDRG